MDSTPTTHSIARRDILKTLGVGVAVGTFGLHTMTQTAAATSHDPETLYLSHSTSRSGSNVTVLFTVDLDSMPGDAVLSEVTSIGAPFQNVDAIAATPDGSTVMFVDRNTRHLGEYDVGSDSFTDLGVVSGLPILTVLAAYGLDGKLYTASNSTNKLYTIDYSVSPPVATEVGEITGAPVSGADIVFDSTGTLFLQSNSNDTLYTVDYQNPSGGTIAATSVGQDTGSSLTGMAVRDAGLGDLVGSSRTDDAIIVLDKSTGQRTATFPMKLNGSPYAYTNGDMATGMLIDENCPDCDSDELLAKYEYEYEVDDGQVIIDTFTPEEATDHFAFVEYGDEMGEPMWVTFDTDYCSVYAVLKSGQEFEVQSYADLDGSVTVDTANDEKYAISFVAFFCTEDAAEAFVDSFPSTGNTNGNQSNRNNR